MPDTQTYRVHARGEDASHGHAVDAVSFEDAAVAFVELWHPPVSKNTAALREVLAEYNWPSPSAHE